MALKLHSENTQLYHSRPPSSMESFFQQKECFRRKRKIEKIERKRVREKERERERGQGRGKY